MREKLLSLIGRIGRDGREPKTTTRVRSKYNLYYFVFSLLLTLYFDLTLVVVFVESYIILFSLCY
jgi:hypothetical protein